jgi:hypothetical protein
MEGNTLGQVLYGRTTTTDVVRQVNQERLRRWQSATRSIRRVSRSRSGTNLRTCPLVRGSTDPPSCYPRKSPSLWPFGGVRGCQHRVSHDQGGGAVKRDHCGRYDQLRQRLQGFIDACNFAWHPMSTSVLAGLHSQFDSSSIQPIKCHG